MTRPRRWDCESNTDERFWRPPFYYMYEEKFTIEGEKKEGRCRFTRVDSDVIDKLIVK